MAAITASEVAAKLIKPGNTNQQVTDAMAKVAEAYGVSAVQGTLMHQLKRYVACLRKEGSALLLSSAHSACVHALFLPLSHSTIVIALAPLTGTLSMATR